MVLYNVDICSNVVVEYIARHSLYMVNVYS